MTSVTLIAVLAMVVIASLRVDGTSPVRCPTECYSCDAVNCACGSYKDQCQCCDICRKCRGESCLMIAGELCQEGDTCGDPNRSLLAMYNEPAKCVPGK